MGVKGFEIDNVLEELNPLGAYQFVQTLVFMFGDLTSCYQLFIIIFVGHDVTHYCAQPECVSNTSDLQNTTLCSMNESSVHYGECHIKVNASTTVDELGCTYGMRYDTPKSFSIVSDFDLVCDHSALSALPQTFLMIGQAIGAIVFPGLSDRYGRKRIHVICQALLLVCGVVNGLAPTYAIFVVSKFCIGAVQQGCVLTLVTSVLESFPARYRGAISGVFASVFWALASASLTPWVYLLRSYSWRIRQFAVSSVSLIFILQQLILDEPLRWLAANGRTKEIIRNIERASRKNGRNAQYLLTFLRGTLQSEECKHQNEACRDIRLAQRDEHSTTRSQNPASRKSHDEETCMSVGSGQRDLDVGTHSKSVSTQLDKEFKGNGGNRDMQKDASTSTGSTGMQINNDTDCETRCNDVINDNVDCSENFHDDPLFHPDTKPKTVAVEKLSLIDLMRNRRLRINSLCVWMLWCINSLTYFALYLTSASLTGNPYLGFFLNAIVQIPTCILLWFSLDKIGRKRTLTLFHLSAGLGLLTSGIMRSFKDSQSLQVAASVMSLVGMLSISGAFNCVFFYTPEIFPTNIRNQAIGTASTAARFGGMIAPFTGILAKRFIWAPGAIFGICNILVLFLIRLLPESRGRELPQTVADLERWYETPRTNLHSQNPDPDDLNTMS